MEINKDSLFVRKEENGRNQRVGESWHMRKSRKGFVV
jgi:hypothetical protein